LKSSQTEQFVPWLAGLRDLRARAKVLARIERLTGGNPGDVKPVGAGVSELRINYGPGYRVYDLQRGTALIILLAGGDKSSQAKGIEKADGDASFIAKALGDIARAQGMTQVARDSGLSRESLYKAWSGERSPSFDTILKVVTALGLKLSANVRNEAELA
jgi:putative addiction module killer protein